MTFDDLKKQFPNVEFRRDPYTDGYQLVRGDKSLFCTRPSGQRDDHWLEDLAASARYLSATD